MRDLYPMIEALGWLAWPLQILLAVGWLVLLALAISLPPVIAVRAAIGAGRAPGREVHVPAELEWSGHQRLLPPGACCCRRCLAVVLPGRTPPGSGWIELILWLVLIVPGVLYSVWRITAERHYCPVCECDELVPASSARGVAIVDHHQRVAGQPAAR